jgi:ribose 5-phosphate isomerase B
MRVAFAADDENDTTRAVLGLLTDRGVEVIRPVPGPASPGPRSAGSEATGATSEGGATEAPGSARAERATSDTVPSASWPDLGAAVGSAVVDGTADYGIVMCWTGTGTAIAANKIPGVRAALAW